jgi:hypothetical protein
MKKFLWLLVLAPGAAFGQAQVVPNVGTGNQTGGAIVYAPVGNCTGCTAMPITTPSGTSVTVVTTPLQKASTNGSTTIVVGGTFQTLLAANATRNGCLIQNPTTATEVLDVFVGATGSATAAASYTLSPGATFNCANQNGMVITDNIAVTAATSAHAFVETNQ